MATVSGVLVHYHGWCEECGKMWSSRNVMGIAVQHTNKYGHATYVETGHAYKITSPSSASISPRLIQDV